MKKFTEKLHHHQTQIDFKIEPLSPAELYYQKTLFEETLVRELLTEVKFLWDVMADRASARKGFKEKLLDTILSVLAKGLSIGSLASGVAAPCVALGGALVESIHEYGLSQWFEYQKGKKVTTLGNLFYAEDWARLEVGFRQFAKAASLRYEWLIAVALSKKPNEGVIPLACTGARRVMEYLCRLAQEATKIAKNEEEFKQLPLSIDTLLDALIQGHSGRWVNSLKNTRLIGRSIWQAEKLNAEGAYGRAAMRLLLPGQVSSWGKKWGVYYTLEAKHKQEDYDKHYDWGRVKLLEKKFPDKGPKYGYMLVTEETRNAYGHDQIFQLARESTEYFNHYPTVKIANLDDIEQYNEVVQNSMQGKKPYPTFLEFIKNKYKQQRIDQVWVRNVNLPDLNGGDYTDIDFSGCSFEGAHLKNTLFNRANLTFTSFKDAICENISFDQANLSYSNFEDAEFKEKISYIGAIWIGANLKGLKKEQTDRLKELEGVKQMQEKQSKALWEKLFEFQQKMIEVEKRMIGERQEIDEKLQKLKVNNAQMQDEVIQIRQFIDELTQTQINYSRFQFHCQAQLTTLESAVSNGQQVSQTQRQELDALKKQIEGIAQSHIDFESLMNEFQKQLAEKSEINQKTLDDLAQNLNKFTDIHERFAQEIYGIKDRLSNVEADLDEFKDTLSERTRQTLILHAFDENILEQGAQAKFGSAEVNLLEVKGSQALTEAEQKWVTTMVEKASQANMKVFAFRHNQLASASRLETGNAKMRAVFLNKTESHSSSSTDPSFELPKYFPASKSIQDKAKTLQEKAKQIYSETDKDYLAVLPFLKSFESESFSSEEWELRIKKLKELEKSYASISGESMSKTAHLKEEVEEEKSTSGSADTPSTQFSQASNLLFLSPAPSSSPIVSETALKNFPSLTEVQSFEANDDDGINKVKVIFANIETAGRFSQELSNFGIKLKDGRPRKAIESSDTKSYVYVTEDEFNRSIQQNEDAYNQLLQSPTKPCK